ncbi:hypothetical protein EOM81_06110, partial [bacterium]|nr:hypothetical protein [bacterium]
MATEKATQTQQVAKKEEPRSIETIRAELIEIGTKQGYLSYQAIIRMLPEGLPTDVFEEVVNELMEKEVELLDDDEIRLDKKLPVAEEKKEDEIQQTADFEDIDDSVRVYLREIGKIRL